MAELKKRSIEDVAAGLEGLHVWERKQLAFYKAWAESLSSRLQTAAANARAAGACTPNSAQAAWVAEFEAVVYQYDKALPTLTLPEDG